MSADSNHLRNTGVGEVDASPAPQAGVVQQARGESSRVILHPPPGRLDAIQWRVRTQQICEEWGRALKEAIDRQGGSSTQIKTYLMEPKESDTFEAFSLPLSGIWFERTTEGVVLTVEYYAIASCDPVRFWVEAALLAKSGRPVRVLIPPGSQEEQETESSPSEGGSDTAS